VDAEAVDEEIRTRVRLTLIEVAALEPWRADREEDVQNIRWGSWLSNTDS
jgi:hypothetical protein